VTEFGVRLRFRRRQFDHVGDVGARDERLVARAGEHKRTSACRFGVRQCLLDRFEGVDSEGVELLRAVDGDRRHVAVVVDVEVDRVPRHTDPSGAGVKVVRQAEPVVCDS